MKADEIAKLPTKRTELVLQNAPKHPLAKTGEILLVTPAPSLYDHSRALEQQLAAAVMALECARRHMIRSKDADADSIWIDESLAAIKETG